MQSGATHGTYNSAVEFSWPIGRLPAESSVRAFKLPRNARRCPCRHRRCGRPVRLRQVDGLGLAQIRPPTRSTEVWPIHPLARWRLQGRPRRWGCSMTTRNNVAGVLPKKTRPQVKATSASELSQVSVKTAIDHATLMLTYASRPRTPAHATYFVRMAIKLLTPLVGV